MKYIAKNTSLHLATEAVTDEQRNFVTNAILLHTSVLWFSHIVSILASPCILLNGALCMSIVRCLHSVCRVAILAFFKPKTTNLTFFENVWLANFLLAFWLFFGFFIIENLKFGFVLFVIFIVLETLHCEY